MRRLVICLGLLGSVYAQAPQFSPFRYDDDWTFLADRAKRSDVWDPLKYIALGRDGWFMSLGGEMRERYERLDRPGFGAGPRDEDGYLLQRYLLSVDTHFGARFRVFAELQSGLENGRTGGPRPTDLDRLDVHQAFADFGLARGDGGDLTLRVGRQELGFGGGRLISPAEGLNLRRSMDGVRFTGHRRRVVWSASLLKLVQTTPGVFDDKPDHAQTLWGTGITAPHPLWQGATFATYYLGLDRKSALFAKGIGRSRRHTVGLHSWKSAGGWDFDYEGVTQFGTFGAAPIRAWAVSENTGYTWRGLAWKPRLGVRADVASGDGGAGARSLGSFDPLLPAIPVYSGPSAQLGPTNLTDVTPSVSVQFGRKWSLQVESSTFWRTSVRDGIYNSATVLIRPANRSEARYVASIPSVTLTWRESRHLTVAGTAAYVFTGRFLRETPPDNRVQYLSVWMTYRF